MKELMIHVERAVRPIRAASSRKLKMRQELLAHLTGIYEEEKARLGDERQALDHAVRRFGKPSELTRDLQASVPFLEQLGRTPVPGMSWDRHLDKWGAKRAGESTLHHAMRLAACVAVFVCACQLAAQVLEVVLGYSWKPRELGLAFSAVLVVYAFLSTLWGYAIWRLVAERMTTAKLLWAAACAVASILSGLALPAVGHALQPENPLWLYLRDLLRHSKREPLAQGAVIFFAVMPMAVALPCGLLLRMERTRQQRSEEWTSLQIEE